MIQQILTQLVESQPVMAHYVNMLQKHPWYKTIALVNLTQRFVHVYTMKHVKFDIRRSLWAVPMVALYGDEDIYNYDGKRVSKKTYLEGKTPWISPAERLLMRRKVIVAECMIYKRNQPFVMLHYAAPQFEMDYLEASQFLSATDNQLKVDLYRQAMLQDVKLLLGSFFDYLQRKGKKKGILRVPPVGLGYFARLSCGLSIKKLLEPELSWAWEKGLELVPEEAIECDFVGWAGPVIRGKSRRSTGDVIEWQQNDVGQEKDHPVYGIVNGGDCFSMPGNEFSDQSLDSYLGQNTDSRFILSPWINRNLLSPANWTSFVVS